MPRASSPVVRPRYPSFSKKLTPSDIEGLYVPANKAHHFRDENFHQVVEDEIYIALYDGLVTFNNVVRFRGNRAHFLRFPWKKYLMYRGVRGSDEVKLRRSRRNFHYRISFFRGSRKLKLPVDPFEEGTKFQKFDNYNGAIKYIRDRNDDSVLNHVLDHPNGPMIEDLEIVEKDEKINKLQAIITELKAETKARLLEIKQLKQALKTQKSESDANMVAEELKSKESKIAKLKEKLQKLKEKNRKIKEKINANSLAMNEETKARLLEIEQLKQALRTQKSESDANTVAEELKSKDSKIAKLKEKLQKLKEKNRKIKREVKTEEKKRTDDC